MAYVGLVQLEDTLEATLLVKNSSRVPKEPDATPTFRSYGGTTVALMNSGTGSATKRDTGTVTGAAGTPIVITAAAHGLSTGTRVTIAGVLGNTAANGDWNVTAINANTFSLDGSTTNAPYTSGGTWHTTGLYGVSLPITAANGYEAGNTYAILVNWAIAAVAGGEVLRFTVV